MFSLTPYPSKNGPRATKSGQERTASKRTRPLVIETSLSLVRKKTAKGERIF